MSEINDEIRNIYKELYITSADRARQFSGIIGGYEAIVELAIDIIEGKSCLDADYLRKRHSDFIQRYKEANQ